MKRTIVFLTLFALIGAVLPVSGQCSLSGWVEDKDRGGTNVRATPAANGKVVKIFPFAKENGEQAMVNIIGYSGGWLKIRSAETVDGTELLKEPAWISAKLVTASVETDTNKPATLYSTPSRKAARSGRSQSKRRSGSPDSTASVLR